MFNALRESFLPLLPRQSSEISVDSSSCPRIEIKDLTICYGDHCAIRNANLTAQPGEVLALVGPSGCGKSSLLAAINRMTDLVPQCAVEGEINFNGRNVLAPEQDIYQLRRTTGMVFQQPNPFPLSVRDNIAFPLKEQGVHNKTELEHRVASVLEAVGLWEEINGRLTMDALKLSGGQQQRLCIARALALEPTALLMDEPCSALDPLSTERIESLIATLKGKLTVIIVTHNLSQARRVADQTAVCWVDSGCGCIVESGCTESIFDASTHPITRAYCQGKAG